MQSELNRRAFLLRAGTGLSALWASAHWPSILAAASHARHAARADAPPKLEFFTQEEAGEIEAITARIIPTDDSPGAREAGVVYFIDRGLATFAAEEQKTYREGLLELHARAKELFPGLEKFSVGTPKQQDQILNSFDEHPAVGRRAFRSRPGAQNFFETLRQHTIVAFLIDPDFTPTKDGAGWKVIGRDRDHMFQPPFGYYDKDYPGWQPTPKETGKK